LLEGLAEEAEGLPLQQTLAQEVLADCTVLAEAAEEQP